MEPPRGELSVDDGSSDEVFESDPGFGDPSLSLRSVIGWATSWVLPSGRVAGRPAVFADLCLEAAAEGPGSGSTDGSDAPSVAGVEEAESI